MSHQEHIIGAHFLTLLRQRTEPLTVRAFGSRVRGNAAADSDFDMLVVVEMLDTETDQFISECAWEAGFEHGVIVSPLAYSRAEYEREASSPLIQSIEREGEVV